MTKRESERGITTERAMREKKTWKEKGGIVLDGRRGERGRERVGNKEAEKGGRERERERPTDDGS